MRKYLSLFLLFNCSIIFANIDNLTLKEQASSFVLTGDQLTYFNGQYNRLDTTINQMKASNNFSQLTSISDQIQNLGKFEAENDKTRMKSIRVTNKPHINEEIAMLKSYSLWDNLYTVHGLSSDDLKKYKITRNNQGSLVTFNGSTIFDTTTLASGRMTMYVMSSAGDIYAYPAELNKFHHSSFLKGAPVASAGEIRTNKNGAVTYINNQSGHYRPNAKEFIQVILELATMRSFYQDAIIDFMGVGKVKALALLADLSAYLANNSLSTMSNSDIEKNIIKPLVFH